MNKCSAEFEAAAQMECLVEQKRKTADLERGY